MGISLRQILLAFLFSGSLALYIVSPSLLAKTSVPAGFEGPDLAGSVWYQWWTSFAVSNWLNPVSSIHTYFPIGQYPVGQFNLLDAFFTMPFYWLFGHVYGYTFGIVSILTSVGVAGFVVARWIGAKPLSAIFSGFAMMSSVYVINELWAGRPAQAFLSPMILGLGLWFRVFNDKNSTYKLSIITGIVSALTFLGYWYYGLFLGIGAFILGIGSKLDRQKLLKASLGLLVTLSCILPFVYLLLSPGSYLPGVETSNGFTQQSPFARGEPGLNWAMEANLWLGWLLGKGSQDIADLKLLYVLGLVGLAPLVIKRDNLRSWFVIAFIAWLFTLGPYPVNYQGDVVAKLPLPYLWFYDYFPFFKRFWWPYRFAALVYICIPLLAAVNLSRLQDDFPKWGKLIPLLAVALLLGESLLRVDYMPLKAGPVLLETDAYKKVDGPIITLPVFGPDAGGRFSLWMQGYHEQPILYGDGGQIDGHRPAEIDELVMTNSFLSTLKAYEWGTPDNIYIKASDINSLRESGFKWVLLDKAFYNPKRAEAVVPVLVAFLEDVLGPPEIVDGRVWLWRLKPASDDYIGGGKL